MAAVQAWVNFESENVLSGKRDMKAFSHQMDVRSCKSEDGLPIVANCEDARVRMLCLQGSKKMGSAF
jgi:hypothetical protein